jgi:thymidylate synthase ThyX
VKLRYSVHAQAEIRNIAQDMLKLVQETKQFDHTLTAFGLTEGGVLRGPF